MSTYTSLGVELQVTGENAGTWGDKTNTNLTLLQQLVGGFNQTSIAGGAQTTALTVVDGNTTGTAQQNMIEFTGTITGNQIVTIPLDIERMYIIRNSTSGSFTVQFKYASGSGDTITFAATDKGTRMLYATANDVTNPDILDVGVVDTSGIQTLTNKTLTSPAIGTSILDTGGNELLKLTATGSAINELTLANAATGNGPTVSATSSSDSNVDININPLGTAAGYGVNLPIKRDISTKELNFARKQLNSLYVQNSRGKFELEFVSSFLLEAFVELRVPWL